MKITTQSIDKIDNINVVRYYGYWQEDGVYQPGNVVLYDKYDYLCVVPDNVGNEPTIDSGRWMVLGVDNVYAAIDTNSATETICNKDTALDPNDLNLKIDFSVAGFGFIGIGDITASSVTIYEYAANGTLISETDYLLQNVRDCSTDWYNYYYCPVPGNAVYESRYILHMLNENTVSARTEFIAGIDGYTAVAYIISGVGEDIGESIYPAKISLENNSLIEKNHLGIAVNVSEDIKEVLEIDLMMDADQSQKVKRIVRSHLNETVLVVGEVMDPNTALYENLMLLGSVRDFNIVLPGAEKSFGYISIEESI